MKFFASISIIAVLFLALFSAMACGRKGPSEEELHRSPMQQGKVPEKTTLKSPKELYDPAKSEYESEYVQSKHVPTGLIWAGTIDQAIQITKGEKNKKKAIIYYASQAPCEECRVIEEKVFSDPAVLKNSDRWVFVRVNIDIQKELAKYNHIEKVPAFQFLDHMGHVYKTYEGTVTPEQFAEMLLTWY
jgi:thiol:disulfide interchange protein